MTNPLLNSLAAATAAAPNDPELRALYASHLAASGELDLALGQVLVVLSQAPDHAGASALEAELVQRMAESITGAAAGPTEQAPGPISTSPISTDGFDWTRAEREIDSPMQAPFVVHSIDEEGTASVSLADDNSAPVEVSRESIKLDDVGGLEQVKKRIREAFLEPMRNPEIAKAFNKPLRGGLLLYGPPGCGKTFMARAIAGELGAAFLSVTISDILDKYIGESEQNLHRTFQTARSHAPAVLFFDEVDAIGGKRSQSSFSGGMRNVINQLLMEMDGIGSDNDGLFVLAATNTPWDVDAALLRPGRFDRMVLVLPPDEPAREAILRYHLAKRPVEGIVLADLVKRTDGYSGADLQHLCDTATELAMSDSIRAGAVRPIRMPDLKAALREVKPSIGPWLESARNVANYGNSDGRYDELVAYLKSRKLL